MHLYDGTTLERLEALMPKVFGITWPAALGTPSVPLYQACTYARQLESVAARWQSGNHSMLQPVVAYPYMATAMKGYATAGWSMLWSPLCERAATDSSCRT